MLLKINFSVYPGVSRHAKTLVVMWLPNCAKYGMLAQAINKINAVIKPKYILIAVIKNLFALKNV